MEHRFKLHIGKLTADETNDITNARWVKKVLEKQKLIKERKKLKKTWVAGYLISSGYLVVYKQDKENHIMRFPTEDEAHEYFKEKEKDIYEEEEKRII